MANPKGNPQNFPKRSSEEARKNGAKGGKRSGEVRGQIKTFRETFKECTSQNEMAEMIESMKREALKGNVAAWKELRDLIGEKPSLDLTNSDGSFGSMDITVTFDEATKA